MMKNKALILVTVLNVVLFFLAYSQGQQIKDIREERDFFQYEYKYYLQAYEDSDSQFWKLLQLTK